MVPVKQCSYREEQYTVQKPVYNTVMQTVITRSIARFSAR